MIVILLLILGLIIGSFLGALTYRLPRKINISKGRSVCDSCKHKINWFDNIPVISYLALGGKCRNCKKEISIRYPVIELVTAIVFVSLGANPINLVIASILIAIAIIDFEEQIIPDELVFIGLALFAIGNIQYTIYTGFLAGFLAALILLFLNLVTRGKGMGLGDVKLALLLGSIAGIDLLFPWLFFSFASGAVTGIIMMLVKKAGIKERIPFGPFLIIGLVLAIYFGKNFLNFLHI